MEDEEEEKKPRLFFPKLKLDLSGWRWFDKNLSCGRWFYLYIQYHSSYHIRRCLTVGSD
jgi:hypothetical protein